MIHITFMFELKSASRYHSRIIQAFSVTFIHTCVTSIGHKLGLSANHLKTASSCSFVKLPPLPSEFESILLKFSSITPALLSLPSPCELQGFLKACLSAILGSGIWTGRIMSCKWGMLRSIAETPFSVNNFEVPCKSDKMIHWKWSFYLRGHTWQCYVGFILGVGL